MTYAKAIRQRFLRFISFREQALVELRARWGRPLCTFRDRKTISGLYALTHNPNETVDDATWHDLDMDDLFDRLDNNITPIGRQYLYRQLRTYEADEKKLEEQHLTARHFTTDKQLREQTQLNLMGLSNSNATLITNMLFGEFPTGDFPKIVVWLLAGSSLVSIVSALVNPAYFWLPLITILINFIFTIKHEDSIGRHTVSFGYLKKLVQVAARLPCSGIHTSVPQLGYLQNNHSNIRERHADFRMLGYESTSTNPLIAQLAFYTNLICLFDFFIFIRLSNYLNKHKTQLIEIYNVVASLDSAISIASYISTADNLCNPEFCADHTMSFEMVAHPLLTNAVPNSFSSTKRSALVTGSNMAGKSTFIKTIGINLILAQTIWLCRARSARVPRVPVLSSIKNTDSLKEGKSYYFAEIEALLRLIDAAKSDQAHVFLIDEILHGTNTVERVASAAAILDFLSTNNTVLVTSHDVELTRFLHDRYRSFHFRETSDLEHMFDYKIHDGHCTTRNAISLLKAIGFPSSVIDAARINARQLD